MSAFVFYNQTIVGIVSLVSRQVLKTLPAFVIVLIVKICSVTSLKLVFLSMFNKSLEEMIKLSSGVCLVVWCLSVCKEFLCCSFNTVVFIL